MNKTIQYLSLALIVQFLILATVLFSKNQNSQTEGGLLLEFNQASIDSIIVGDSAAEIEIKKQQDAWRLPSYGDLPVKEDKVNDVLSDLAELKVSWPVASSNDAATRFEVSKENAQKSLKIKSGDEIVGKLYMGTSPGYKKVHARVSDDDDIYAVEFSQHQVSTKGEDWFDKSLLSVSGEIEALTIGENRISKTEAGWNITGVNPAETNLTEVESWLKNLNNLQVSKLVQGNDKDKLLVQNPNLEIQVTSNGQLSAYKLWNKEDSYFIKSSASDHLFEIASYQAKKYFDFDSSKFKISETDSSAAGETQSLTLPPLTPEAGTFPN